VYQWQKLRLASLPSEVPTLANNLPAPASALLATEVTKNLRRVHKSIDILLKFQAHRDAL
jgi:hypothetical protein